MPRVTTRVRPDRTRADVTEAAAAEFARLSESLRKAGAPSEVSAHFLMRLLFCLFAEDIGLLADGLVSKITEASKGRAGAFRDLTRALLAAMASGGYFGTHSAIG